jgi:cytochrome c nitrite reductase small subunit
MKRWRRLAGTSAIGISTAGVLLCALIGLAVGSGSFTFVYGQGFSYLSNDPKACMNCHIMRDHFDGWQKSSHHAHATCNDCHTPHAFIPKYLSKAENGIWHSKGFTFQDFHEPIRIRPHNSAVLEHNCTDCHQELVQDIAGHGERGDRDSMRHGNQAWGCVHCHPHVGHGPAR